MSTLFPTGHATHPDPRMALAIVVAQLRAQMALPQYAVTPALGLVYLTDHFASQAATLLAELRAAFPAVQAWSGTAGIGVAANNAEYFDEPALSVMLLDLPETQFRVFSGLAPLPRSAQDGFVAHTALVHADAHTPDLPGLLVEMAERTATGYLFGGLTASRGAQVQLAWRGGLPAGGAIGTVGDGVFEAGLSGVAFGPGVGLVSRVTQGCQPIGVWHRITAAQDNVVLTLDDRPALEVLLETLGVRLDRGDPQPALRKVRATLAGLEDPDGTAPSSGAARRTGHFGADTRVRHIIGLDGARQGVALAEHLEVGMRLAFCQRNVAAARADLMRICAEIREALSPEDEVWSAPEAAQAPVAGMAPSPGLAAAEGLRSVGRSIRGAIYVSCSGRGGPHFGGPSAELQIVRHALGDVPLVGFFAAGEIARHHLYGYTGVLTVFADTPEDARTAI